MRYHKHDNCQLYSNLYFFFLDNPSLISFQGKRYGDNFNRDYTAAIVTNTHRIISLSSRIGTSERTLITRRVSFWFTRARSIKVKHGRYVNVRKIFLKKPQHHNGHDTAVRKWPETHFAHFLSTRQSRLVSASPSISLSDLLGRL